MAAGQHIRALLLGLGFVPNAIVLAGCAQRQRPIFEERRPALVWPAPPNPPKIRYVGQLTSKADLKPARKPFQAIGEFFVGTEEPERLYGPRSLVCTPDGERVWIADPGGRCLHLFDLRARSYKNIRHLNDAQLLSPVDVCLGREDSIYACDSEFVAIHRIAADSGEWLETLRIPEEILRPAAIDYDVAADELYVVDSAAHDVKVLSRAGSLQRIVGRRGSAPGEFNFPCDIVGNGDMIWVVDAGNHRVQGLTRAGEPVVAFGQAGDAPGDLALPKGVALDSEGHVYVVDARFENVQTFDRSGHLLLAFGQEGTAPGEFWLPASIFIDANDRIWVCDTYNGRVQVFDYLKDELTPKKEQSPAETQPAETQRPGLKEAMPCA